MARATGRKGEPPGEQALLPIAVEPAAVVEAPAPGEGDLPDKLYFRIGEAAQIVGVDAHVLRYWEQEFRLRPGRSDTGQRLYRRADVVRFLRIRHLLHDQGFTIAGAKKAISGGATAEAAVEPSAVREALDALSRARAVLRALKDELA